MNDAKRRWERLSEEKKQAVINELIHFFEQERGEEIGVVAATQLLDFFLQRAGPEIYNKGVLDAKKAMENRFEDLGYDLDDLLDL